MKCKSNKKEKNINKNHDASLSNLHPVKYNTIWLDEYKMMREELVNYMEKLQTVRNMLYVSIGTIFGFSISQELPFFCVLLPLLLILPSYMLAVDYWVCVRKASAYLVVFHESYEDCPIHWESRHNMLKKMNNKKENFKKSIFRNVPLQLASYYACAAINMIVYLLRLYKYVDDEMNLDESVVFCDISIDGIPISIYIITGIVVTIFLIVFFICFSRGESYECFIKKFLLIKNREYQCEIGKCWTDGLANEKDDIYEKTIYQEISKYL